MIGQVATQNARIAESIDLVRQEWRRMAEAGPTESEVRDAKTYLIGSFPISLDSTGSIAATLVAMQRYDLGPDRSEEHTSELQSLMRISYAVFCLHKKKSKTITQQSRTIR